MSWYKIVSSNDINGFIAGGHLADLYKKEYPGVGSTKGAPIFEVNDGSEIYYVISPNAAVIAPVLLSVYDTVQCDRPIINNSKILIGHPDDLDLLK